MDRIMEFVMYTIIMPPIICVYLAILVVSFNLDSNYFLKLLTNGGNKNG